VDKTTASINGARSFAIVVFPTPGNPQTITINIAKYIFNNYYYL
jgi:hypothetical protein